MDETTIHNQTGDSNKFWNLVQTDNSYTVTWGKIGTEGRTNDNFRAESIELEYAPAVDA
jgi:predicted DNA-binding WGR domain protein